VIKWRLISRFLGSRIVVARSWNGSADDWNTPADWTGGVVPDATDDVTIDSGSPQVTGPISANSIDNSGALQFHNAGPGSSVVGDVINSGELSLDAAAGDAGGSTLTIGGALSNAGMVAVGNDTLSATTTLSASSFDNAGGLLSITGYDTNQATVTLGSVAGLATVDGRLDGDVQLIGNALLEFASGTIDTIDFGASLALVGAQARVAVSTDTTSNSALTGLAYNYGALVLADGASVTTHDLADDPAVALDFDNEGIVSLDALPGEGGSELNIDGAFLNYYVVAVGNSALSADTTLTAASFFNDGLLSITGGTTYQATVRLASAADLCTSDGLLMGDVELSGNALLEFATGTIHTIELGGSLSLDGADARINSAAADPLVKNSALTGLAFNYGGFQLTGGASVETLDGVDLENQGGILLDACGCGDGGSSLAVGGTLTNFDTVAIGNEDLSVSTTLSADAFVNDDLALLSIIGGDTAQATVSLGSLAGLGTAGSLTGEVELIGNALLEFAGGSIDTIELDASLLLLGAQARVAVTGDLDGNSALIGLARNDGRLELANGAIVETTDGVDFTNTGDLYIDEVDGDGGSTLSIGGEISNVGRITVGNDDLSADTTLAADSLDNEMTLSIIGSATHRATVNIASDADLSSTGTGFLDGIVRLRGNALLQFASGTITTIGSSAALWLDGAQAFVAIAGALDRNSALTGLTDNEGALDLSNGAEVAITGFFNNSGGLYVDGSGGDGGGSALTIGGTLVNAGMISLGNADLSSSASIATNALVNLAPGSIELYGSATGQGRLAAGPAVNAGTITVGAGGVLDVAGNFWLDGNSLLTVEDGGTLTTGAMTTVLKGGAGTTSTIDLQGQSFESRYKIVVESGVLQFTDTTGVTTPTLTGAGIIQGEVFLDLGANVLTITPTGQPVGDTNVFHFWHTDLGRAYTNVVAADGSMTITGSNRGEILTGGDFNDKIYAGSGADTLDGEAGDDDLRGRAGSDELNAGDGNDRLDGGADADVMKGGVGNDRFFVDNAADVTTELEGEGTADTIYARVDYTLGADDEIEYLRGNAGDVGLMLGGNRFDNRLIGRAGNDTLSGGDGDDRLDGHDGADTLDAGAGNDRLDGGLGADSMTGGEGDDFFYVDNAADEVFEGVGGGVDAVYASISYSLAAEQEIESLRASAGAAGLTLGGNGFDNTIFGAAGNDWLSGGDGEDKLYGRDGDDTVAGGAGNDLLKGETGADIFLFDAEFMTVANVDTVGDFELGTDEIHLDKTYFGGLELGPLDAAAFALNHATGTDAQIVYDEVKGWLTYDSNGVDPGGATMFAKVTGAPTLTAASFVVVT